MGVVNAVTNLRSPPHTSTFCSVLFCSVLFCSVLFFSFLFLRLNAALAIIMFQASWTCSNVLLKCPQHYKVLWMTSSDVTVLNNFPSSTLSYNVPFVLVEKVSSITVLLHKRWKHDMLLSRYLYANCLSFIAWQLGFNVRIFQWRHDTLPFFHSFLHSFIHSFIHAFTAPPNKQKNNLFDNAKRYNCKKNVL
jgi:hypothetical protein